MPADTLLGYMLKGGFFMYPILLCSIVSLAIFLEKLRMLQRTRVIPPGFLVDFEHMLRAEKISPALELCKQTDAPISRILAGGIKNYGKRREVIKELIEEVGKREAAYLEKYVEGLATIANVATLLGLLGTIMGLIQAFTAVANANPAEKADLLSASISVAMNTTAFGLMSAIPLLLFHAKLTSTTGQIIDGTCLNMTMWSYINNVNLCVLADKKVLPDGWKLYDYFTAELAKLVALIPQDDTQAQASTLAQENIKEQVES